MLADLGKTGHTDPVALIPKLIVRSWRSAGQMWTSGPERTTVLAGSGAMGYCSGAVCRRLSNQVRSSWAYAVIEPVRLRVVQAGRHVRAQQRHQGEAKWIAHSALLA